MPEAATLRDLVFAGAALHDALCRHEQLDNHAYVAHIWSCLGEAHSRNRDPAQAIDAYRHAIELFGKIGGRYGEASAQTHLAMLLQDANDPRADEARLSAHVLADSLDPPAVDQLRQHLRQLT